MSINLHGHQSICAELMQLRTDLKTVRPSYCRSCKAYKRGREDAAQAIIDQIDTYGTIPMSMAIIAAKGDNDA